MSMTPVPLLHYRVFNDSPKAACGLLLGPDDTAVSDAAMFRAMSLTPGVHTHLPCLQAARAILNPRPARESA